MQKDIKKLMQENLEEDFVIFLINRNRTIIRFILEFFLNLFVGFILLCFFLTNKLIKEQKPEYYLILFFYSLFLLSYIVLIFYFYLFFKKIKLSKNKYFPKHEDFFKNIYKSNFLEKFREKRYLTFYNQYLQKKDSKDFMDKIINNNFKNLIIKTLEPEFKIFFQKRIKISMIFSIVSYTTLSIVSWSFFIFLLFASNWKFENIFFYPTLTVLIVFTLIFIFLIVKNFYVLKIIKKFNFNIIETHKDLYNFMIKNWIILTYKKRYYLKSYFDFRKW